MNSLHIDNRGIVSGALFIESPNQDHRPPDSEITLIVIHNISLPPQHYGGDGVIQLFTNQLDPKAHPYYAEIHQLRVSSHFFIRRDGSLLQFVPCQQRAWHAGKSTWQGHTNCNDFSIGVEVTAFEAAQYTMLNRLLLALRQAYPIASTVGHSDITPGRKTDPGPFFDWSRLQLSA